MNLQLKTWVASERTGSAFEMIVAHVVLLNGFSCFYFCRSWRVGGPWTLCLSIGPHVWRGWEPDL